jgi:hypothetical protein
MEAYNQNMKFDQLSEDERDLIFAIALGDFNLKLERNDIREVVKEEIYKAACREIGNYISKYSRRAKNLLLYYRFESSRKKKKNNFLMQLGDEEIRNMYDLEAMGITVAIMNDIIGFTVAKKYRIKKIFWEDCVISETTKYRLKVWTALDKLPGDVKYRTSKWKNEADKERAAVKLKKVVLKDNWDEVLKRLNEKCDSFPDWYFHKHIMMDNWPANTFN